VSYTGPEYAEASAPEAQCRDCGLLVSSIQAHTRFHAILSAHALAIAILKTSHVSSSVHDRYDVDERIRARDDRLKINVVKPG
jgi:hypothetical protein